MSLVSLFVNRTNVSLRVDILLTKTSDGTHATGAFIASNVNSGGCQSQNAKGVYLWVSADEHKANLTGNQRQ